MENQIHKRLDILGDYITKNQTYFYAAGALSLIALALIFGHRLILLPNAGFNLIAWSLVSMMGVTLGYHRYFTHRSFQASRPVVIALGIAALLSAQGKLKHWVATHRLHHRYADSIYDPHSPFEIDEHGNGTSTVTLRSFFWAHWFWQVMERSEYFGKTSKRELKRIRSNKNAFAYTNQLRADLQLKQLGWNLRDWYSKDLQSDPILRKFDQYYPAFWLISVGAPVVLSIIFSAINQMIHSNPPDSSQGIAASAFSGLVWGYLARLVLVQELTNMINSISHIVGYCQSQSDESKIKIGQNTPVLALLNLGESHHYNHHLNPTKPNFGRRWFELDIAYQALRLLALTGLVKMKSSASEQKS